MRGTYKYNLKDGKRIVHRGITKDLSRREQEHQAEYLGARIRQVGRRATREAALEWERNRGN